MKCLFKQKYYHNQLAIANLVVNTVPNTAFDWKRVSLHSNMTSISSTTRNTSARGIVTTIALHSQGYRKPARHYSEQVRAKEQPAFELILLIVLYRGNACRSSLGTYILFLLLLILQQYVGILDKFRPP